MIINIQYLRGFAASNVVLYHIIGASLGSGERLSILSFLEGWGSNGVDIFFVISGFIIFYSHTSNPKSSLEFIRGRLIRIVPIYWVLTTIFLLVIISSPFQVNTSLPSITHLISSFFFLSKLSEGLEPILYVGWTLELEAIFYLTFCIVIYLKSSIERFIVSAVLISMIAVLFNIPIIFEFIFGMAIAAFTRHDKPNKFLAVSSLLFGFVSLLSPIFYNIGLSRVIVSGLPGAFLLYGTIKLREIHFPLFLKLGESSYSIYLTQVFCIPFFYKITNFWDTGISPDFLAITCLIFTLLIGYFCYIFLERPSLHFLKRRSIRST